MRADERVVLLGQDIAEYGGAFKVTDGFVAEFGKERVRNTPIVESSALGCALGLALDGFHPMVEMQFGDFISCGFNQVVNNLATTHYRWGAPVPVVIRAPVGGGTGAGPFHSQNIEAFFANVPGLRIVAPATPADAKGLLLAAFDDPNPVLFLEHKALYRAERGPVPAGWHTVPFGEARVARPGCDATVVTYGIGVRWALEAAGHPGRRRRRRRRGDRPADAAAVGHRHGAGVGGTDRAGRWSSTRRRRPAGSAARSPPSSPSGPSPTSTLPSCGSAAPTRPSRSAAASKPSTPPAAASCRPCLRAAGLLNLVRQPVQEIERPLRAVDGQVGSLEELHRRLGGADGDAHRMGQPSFGDEPGEGVEGGQVAAVVADDQRRRTRRRPAPSAAVPLSTSSGGRSSSVRRPGSSRRP